MASSCSLSAQDMKPAKAAGAPPKTAYYIDPSVMDLEALIPNAPVDGAQDQKTELGDLHSLEASRTAQDVAVAKADESEEDLFLYKTVFGDRFNAQALPVTAGVGVHVENEASVAGGILKTFFQRVRPYNADKSLHPVCQLTEVANSYPSGHALVGYLEGFTLAEIVPEKRAEILARADDFAHNRLVCGVHYPSDVEASRKVAYVVFGYMLATPRFQRDLAAARTETRAVLGLPAK
ncbi:MAG: phosphatase PAP2 family protein [Acidobacteriota bacterium]|nr:phosphatase PAP2 family protein [Acidobacteriota bacterium]